MLAAFPRLARRATLIYLATIVVPVAALLWLGLQSFERQRQAVETLRADKIATAVDREARTAAAEAVASRAHPIAHTYFVLDKSGVVEPALEAPMPRELPAELEEAVRLELADRRPDLAIARYRLLIQRHTHESLAMQYLARSLAALGRHAEARDVWRTLAATFGDEYDLSGRPFGIVAAINAGDSEGLVEAILAGRWNLAAGQAEYFLRVLGAPGNRLEAFLERFAIARELATGFRPPLMSSHDEIQAATVGARRVFYRTDELARTAGIVANAEWLAALEHRVRNAARADVPADSLAFYAGATGVLLLVLSAGIFILHRDVSRESRLNQQRTDFVNGVTHELKTPVTIMRLYGETLLKQPNLTDAERRDFYRVIGRESARLGRLVDQVLTMSRIDRGDARYELLEDDPAPLISGVVEDYAGWLERAGFSLNRQLPASMPSVRFDPAAVSQAVVNLLDNAAKYSGSSKEIAVRLAAADGCVIFEVQDRGVGIPPTEQGRIFDRFYRAANDSGKGGYGLGLFMVRHIMAAHDGRADVTSEPGQGSTFRLVFPVAAS
jgi:signal transduction histidine kinase